MQYMHIHYTTNILQKIKIDCYTYIKKQFMEKREIKKSKKIILNGVEKRIQEQQNESMKI